MIGLTSCRARADFRVSVSSIDDGKFHELHFLQVVLPFWLQTQEGTARSTTEFLGLGEGRDRARDRSATIPRPSGLIISQPSKVWDNPDPPYLLISPILFYHYSLIAIHICGDSCPPFLQFHNNYSSLIFLILSLMSSIP